MAHGVGDEKLKDCVIPFLRARLSKIATNSSMLLDGINACLIIISFDPMISVSCFKLERSAVRSLSIVASWRSFAAFAEIFAICPEIKNTDVVAKTRTTRAMRVCLPMVVKRFFVVNILLFVVYRTRVFQAKRYRKRNLFFLFEVSEREFNLRKKRGFLKNPLIIVKNRARGGGPRKRHSFGKTRS